VTTNLAKLIIAVTFSDKEAFQSGLAQLKAKFGEIDYHSAQFTFDYTDYYSEEMGANLQKQFFSFRELIGREQLIDIKHESMKIESMFSLNAKRQVNIDPGYLELAKLVVASTKNYAHRIFLARGIYGDVQLMFKGGRFVFNEWTYFDYRSREVIEFMENVRAIYYKQLKVLE